MKDFTKDITKEPTRTVEISLREIQILESVFNEASESSHFPEESLEFESERQSFWAKQALHHLCKKLVAAFPELMPKADKEASHGTIAYYGTNGTELYEPWNEMCPVCQQKPCLAKTNDCFKFMRGRLKGLPCDSQAKSP